MKRIPLLLAGLLLFSACVANRAALEQSRVNHRDVRFLTLGMAKADVLAKMTEPPALRDLEVGADGEPIERLKWLTNYDLHMYTVVTIRSGSVTAITHEEGPVP